MDVSRIAPGSQQQGMPATQPSAKPEQEATVPQDLVVINVPITVSKDMVTPGPDGKAPIQDLQVSLLPKNAVVTSREEMQKWMDETKDQILPPGTEPKIKDSKEGALLSKVGHAAMNLGKMAASFGTFTLMSPGGRLGLFSILASVAAPMAAVGGALGAVLGGEQMKQALDMKGYYKNLKAKGVDMVPVPVPVRGQDGKIRNQIQNIPIDVMISGAKDAAVVGGISTLSSALMVAAGLGAPPLVAVAAVVLGVGGPLFAARHAIWRGIKAVGQKVKKMFTHQEKETKPPPEEAKIAQVNLPQARLKPASE